MRSLSNNTSDWSRSIPLGSPHAKKCLMGSPAMPSLCALELKYEKGGRGLPVPIFALDTSSTIEQPSEVLEHALKLVPDGLVRERRSLDEERRKSATPLDGNVQHYFDACERVVVCDLPLDVRPADTSRSRRILPVLEREASERSRGRVESDAVGTLTELLENEDSFGIVRHAPSLGTRKVIPRWLRRHVHYSGSIGRLPASLTIRKALVVVKSENPGKAARGSAM